MQRTEVEHVQMWMAVVVQTDVDALVSAGRMGQGGEHEVHLGATESAYVVVESNGFAAEQRTGDAHDPLLASRPGSGMPPQRIHVDGPRPLHCADQPWRANMDRAPVANE